MATAFEKRDAEFTAMHKKAARMQKLSEYQNKIDALSPQQYERESFPLSRPMRKDVRRELEAEAEIRFSDLSDYKRKERDFACVLWNADMRYDNGKQTFWMFNGKTQGLLTFAHHATAWMICSAIDILQKTVQNSDFIQTFYGCKL